MTYDHTLRSNPRYLAASRTSQRSGAPFENGAPFMPRSTWDHIKVAFYGLIMCAGLFALCLGIAALIGGE